MNENACHGARGVGVQDFEPLRLMPIKPQQGS